MLHSPPPPWYVHAPAPPLEPWAGVVGYKRLPSAVVSSPRAAWDRLTFDTASRRLYVSAGEDGLLALTLNASSGAPLGATATFVPGSNDCNGLVMVPANGSAPALGFCGDVAEFTANTGDAGVGVTVYTVAPDGTPSLLKVVPTNGVGVDNGVYDALHGQVILTLVNGTVVALDARTAALRRSNTIVTPACANDGSPCDPLEYPTVDGKGSLFVNAAMSDQVFRLDAGTLAVTATWDVSAHGCSDPTGLDVDPVLGRVFVGCANPAAPQLLVLNSATGAKVASLPIGRGNDGVRWDATRQRVYAASGVAGNIVVIQQHTTAGVDAYAVREAIVTKQGARTLTFDPVSGVIYTMAPDGRYDPAQPYDVDAFGVSFFPNVWYPNSLEVIALAPPSPTA